MPDNSGHIYFVADGTGRYKIGLTSFGRLETRMKELNGSQAARPLELLLSIDVSERGLAEKLLHEAFKDYRVYGEWFAFPDSMLSEVEDAFYEAQDMFPIGGQYSAPRQPEPNYYTPSYSYEPEIPQWAWIGGAVAVAFILAGLSGGQISSRTGAVAANETAIIDCGKTGGKALNLRSQPSEAGNLVAVVTCGSNVFVEEDLDNGWSKVRTNSARGYMAGNYLSNR
jgi:Meiotically up-regulated gene 113/Bacterial SH3 domain